MWLRNFLLSLSKLCEIMACSLRIYLAFLFRLWSILVQTWKYISVFIHVEAIYHHLSPFSSEEEAEHFGALQSFNNIPKKRRRAAAGVYRRRTVRSLLYNHAGFINAIWRQCISTDREREWQRFILVFSQAYTGDRMDQDGGQLTEAYTSQELWKASDYTKHHRSGWREIHVRSQEWSWWSSASFPSCCGGYANIYKVLSLKIIWVFDDSHLV